MREIFYPNKNIIVADFDYHSALFQFKNEHPNLDIKIINRNEVINKISYSFSKDPIPFLINKGIGYKKARKYLDIIVTAEVNKNKELQELFDALNAEGYLVKDEYGAFELKNSHIFLYEMKKDVAVSNLLKRNNIEFTYLGSKDLGATRDNAYISPNIIYFENKMTQFFYIFSVIRDKAKDNNNQKHRIIVDGEEDIFYAKIMSELFHLPICYVEERPLLTVKSVKDKINKIYSSKKYEFSDEELEDQDLKALKDIVDYYALDTLNDFAYSYANLLEIVASKTARIPIGTGGVVISNRFVFDKNYFTYVTNFNADKFYKIYADDNVLPDTVLREIGYNTSYDKSGLEKRKKINFLRYNNVAVISRVKKHLNDKIFDSPLLKDEDLGWNVKIKYEDSLEHPTFTSEAAFLFSSMELEKSGLKFESNLYNSYFSGYKGLNCGEDFRKNTWSITNLETYINCPFKYFLNILIPLKRDDYAKRFNGTFIHKVFEKFNHLDFNLEEAFKEGEKAYYKQFEKNEIEPTNQDKVSLEVVKYWLRKYIRTYQKFARDISFAESPSDDYELPIEFALSDEKNTYNFKGIIDKVVISQSGDNKYYSIVDYKTGAEEFNPLEVFLGKSIQLPLYYYAIENNIQPDYYKREGTFGGFYIQHVYFSTIKSALKNGPKPYLSEKKLISESRYQGINNQDVNYIASIDPTAVQDGKVKKGSSLLQIKHQFTQVDGDEQIIDSKKVTISKYNFEDLVNDAKDAAIGIINKICAADFEIKPTSFSLDEFNKEQLACNYCPYRSVCYVNKKDAVDYRKAILKRFQKGEK